MITTETQRLAVRRLSLEDREFIVELLNDPDFIRNIGDRGVRTLEDAERYLAQGPFASYEENGYGLFIAELKNGDGRVGLCGLMRRDTLPHPDLAYALLPAYRRQGYAVEMGRAMITLAGGAFGLRRLLAIINPANEASAGVLSRLGFRETGTTRMPGDDHDVRLFELDDTARVPLEEVS